MPPFRFRLTSRSDRQAGHSGRQGAKDRRIILPPCAWGTARAEFNIGTFLLLKWNCPLATLINSKGRSSESRPAMVVFPSAALSRGGRRTERRGQGE